MVSLPPRIQAPGDDLIGSQEPNLLLHGSEIKLLTSKMEFAPLII
jgi:hypothetical protein